MRIEKRNRRPSASLGVGSGPTIHRRVTKTPKESFADLLGSEEHNTLQSMLEEIVRLGDHLLERRTLHDLELYKAAVRQFVRYSVDHAYRLRKGKRLSGNTVQLIDTVDNALADLTEVVLTRETQRIHILSKLELIKGILVDCVR